MASNPTQTLFLESLSAVVRDPIEPHPNDYALLEHMFLMRTSLTHLRQLLGVAGNDAVRALIQAAMTERAGTHFNATAGVINELTVYIQAWNAFPTLRNFWETRGGFGAFVNATKRPF